MQFISDEKIPFPCPQQQGFQKQLSCLTAAFNLQETICANLDLHSNVYAAFLDTEKAFDTVWHSGLFYKLHNLGIKGKISRIIKHNLKSKQRTEECCQKGQNAFYAMLGYGVDPMGLNPMTCVSLYQKVVILYGSEIWNYLSAAELHKINRTQR